MAEAFEKTFKAAISLNIRDLKINISFCFEFVLKNALITYAISKPIESQNYCIHYITIN
jgi:hypothetical protein